jgi:diguanylate cyclase
MKSQDATASSVQNPTELARETLRQLAVRKMVPTPDAYRLVYEEIAGTSTDPSAERTLIQFANTLLELTTELDDVNGFGKRFELAATAHDWNAYSTALAELTVAHLTSLAP